MEGIHPAKSTWQPPQYIGRKDQIANQKLVPSDDRSPTSASSQECASNNETCTPQKTDPNLLRSCILIGILMIDPWMEMIYPNQLVGFLIMMIPII